jgi:hypothetical protein
MAGRRLIALVVLAVALAVPLAIPRAHAVDDWGVYAGADFGAVRADACDGSFCIEGTEVAHRLVFGYRLNRYVGVELDRTDSRSYDWPDAEQGNTGEIRQIGLRLTGTYPINGGFAVLGVIGVNRWDAREINRTGSTLQSLSGNDASVALGFELQLYGRATLRAYLEHTDADLGAAMFGFRAPLF